MDQQIWIIAPQGRVDAASAPGLEAELKQRIAAGATRIVVDFSATRYISSNGLRVLLVALKATQCRDGALKLCALAPRLREILALAGFDRLFEIFDTRAQAEQSFEK